MDWDKLILNAQRAGYQVFEGAEGAWWIRTPAAPRRPSEELGTYRDHRAAWRGAALLNTMFGRLDARAGIPTREAAE
jgi:hypothetical protein